MAVNHEERTLEVFTREGVEVSDPDHPDVLRLVDALAARSKQVKQLERDLARTQGDLHDTLRARDVLGTTLRAYFRSAVYFGGAPARLLARALGRFNMGLDQLVALSQIARRPDGTWHGTSFAQFLIPMVPTRGYLRLRATIDATAPSRASFYFDTGMAFNQREFFDCGAVTRDSVVERLIPLPITAYAFRFDAIQGRGEFTVKAFSVKPVSRLAVNLEAMAGNLRKALRPGPYKPSVWIGLKLLLTGQFGVFHRQLMTNTDSTRVVDEYDLWRGRHEITEPVRQKMRRTIAGWQDPPRFSVVLPVWNVPEQYLRMCLDSVLRQVYPHWELCIADDASPAPHVRRVLQEYAAKDKRIKVVYRTANGNISAASNSALELATAPWVALLDHDDELTEHALFRMAEVIVADPSVGMIYSDEDKLSPDGRRYEPFFKPDWSPEYFMSCMYTCHLGVYRTDLIRQVGAWRSAYDSSQDYDLVLRIVATNPKIVHVPDILYHWRAIATSAASGTEAKPEAPARAGRALQSYLDQTGRPGRVEPGPTPGFHRVRYQIQGNPLVSIVIPSACRPVQFKGRETWHVLECISSIRKLSTYQNVEIILVDDRYVPPALEEALRPLDVRRVSFAEPFNYSRKVNFGVEQARGEQLLLMNDDVEVITPDFIESMLEFSQWPEIGAVGVQLLFDDGRLQHSGVTLLNGMPSHQFYCFPGEHNGYFNSAQVHRNWSAVSAACMMTRADVYRSVGGMSDEYPLNYGDIDYCLKLVTAGKRIVYMPYAKLYHHESASKSGTYVHELEKFKKAWLPRFANDPYYNPNLSTRDGDFRVG